MANMSRFVDSITHCTYNIRMDTRNANQDYTLDELAVRWGVSGQSIRRWIAKGTFPNAYKVGPGLRNEIRIPGSDIIAFEASRKVYTPN